MNFVNVGTDYHIDKDSVLAGAGLDQSGIFTEDVDGDVIPTDDWPIGYDYPFEVSVSGNAVSGNSGLSMGLRLGL